MNFVELRFKAVADGILQTMHVLIDAELLVKILTVTY